MLQNEQLLIHKVKKGDSEAFEILFRDYHQRVFHFIFHFTKNTAETENLVQEVFINIWEMRSQLIEDIPIIKLCYKIAKQKALNSIRKNLNEQVYKNYILKDFEELEHTTEKTVHFDELTDFIRKCIQEIPDRRREIFLYSIDEGLSYKEIAQKLNISENTVDTQIRNALNYIREKIKSSF
jgi:RNA polymerase sigma-70 factor, ECF subfamily